MMQFVRSLTGFILNGDSKEYRRDFHKFSIFKYSVKKNPGNSDQESKQ